MATLTLKQGIEAARKEEIEEVTEVVQVYDKARIYGLSLTKGVYMKCFVAVNGVPTKMAILWHCCVRDCLLPGSGA